MSQNTTTLQQINQKLNGEMRFYVTNRPQYVQLMADIKARVDSDPAHHAAKGRDYTAQAARGAAAFAGCLDRGADAYLSAHPEAAADLMAWASAVHDARKDNYPELTDSQRILLKEFAADWNKNIMPVLAEHVEAYGRPKMSAEGFTRTVRSHLSKAVMKLLEARANPKSGFGMIIVDMHAQELMKGLQLINTNTSVNPHAARLADAFQQQGLTMPQVQALQADADVFAQGFEADPTHMKLGLLDGYKELMREIIFKMPPVPDETKNAVLQLRQGYWDAVETPFFETCNIKARVNGGPAVY